MLRVVLPVLVIVAASALIGLVVWALLDLSQRAQAPQVAISKPAEGRAALRACGNRATVTAGGLVVTCRL